VLRYADGGRAALERGADVASAAQPSSPPPEVHPLRSAAPATGWHKRPRGFVAAFGGNSPRDDDFNPAQLASDRDLALGIDGMNLENVPG
jgi:hypothetical protein